MEHLDKHRSLRHQKSKILAGTLIIFFGIVYLLERTGVNLPNWVISWETILIAAGIVTLYKHNFKHFAGYVMIGVGGIFLINEFRPDTIDSSLIFPIVIILFGVMMLGKAMNLFGSKRKGQHHHTVFDDDIDISSEDFIQSTTFFGGVTKKVVSKDFKGADFTTFFGGTEINLTQADIQLPVTINATTAFGGLTVIVPSNWQVKSELLTIFGGVEDKRPILAETTQDSNKVLTLQGNCFFGGVEIQSYI
ncbi:MAG: hypothetical protein JKY09_02455 [Crocinitomicaceae bacterium]|nr:hypothetical protein [Crocinitomicaceae bacterium]